MSDTEEIVKALLNEVKERVSKDQVFDQEDDYGYTKSEHFTSEIFKIEIGNIPTRYGYNNWKKLFEKKVKAKAHKIQIIPSINKVYVTFKNEQLREKAMKFLNGYEIKGCTLKVKHAQPKKDAMAKKRENPFSKSEDKVKVPRMEETEEDREIAIKNSLIPCWNIAYEDQLKDKFDVVKNTLKSFHKQMTGIKGLDTEIFQYIMKQKKEGGSILCPILPILPSPVEDFYRNKCSFTIGMSQSGKITVGNRSGKYRDHDCAVESPKCLKHVPEHMKSICEAIEEFVVQSKLPPYNRHSHEGYWQQVVIRSNQQNETLAIICICKQDLDESVVDDLQKNLKLSFEDNTLGIKTLLLEVVKVREKPAEKAPLKLLFGEGWIYENLLGLQFRISPTAFFQCNTLAAEVLYKTISEMTLELVESNSNKDDLLLDICCGTGTIALTMAKQFKKVIGIDLCEEGIRDARVNSQLNGIENVEFLAGKAEKVLPQVLRNAHQYSNIVAIVDPPRCGVHPTVIASIRSRPQIKSLIFVACSLPQTKHNVIDLMRSSSKKLNGPPFKPFKSRPVDMFPHTKHIEVVTSYRRIGDS